jgi:hypothetical protein
MFAIGQKLKNLFDKVCQSPNCEFSFSDFSWEQGFVSETDVVVYCLGQKKYSIIASKGKQAIHDSASGGTFAYSGRMISEVYLRSIDGAAEFSTLAANLIFHEIMHNKIDALNMNANIHTNGGGGLADKVITIGSQLTQGNIDILAPALSKPIKQYITEMQKPVL